MENNIFKKILAAFFYTIMVVIASEWGFGLILNAMFNYSSVEASYHLSTQALLIGLIFTVIFCTTLILERLKNKS